MCNILKQKTNKIKPFSLKNLDSIKKISVSPDNPSTIHFKNGQTIKSTCLRCPNTPCYKFSKEEIALKVFSECAYDVSNLTCPTDAISIDSNTFLPIIDVSKCIGCGICTFRCPNKAIYLKNNVAMINKEIDKKEEIYYKTISFDEFDTVFKFLNNIKYEGSTVFETDLIINKIYENTLNLSKRNSKFPNIFIRNILLTLGTIYNSSKTGDNSFRMDGLLRSNSKLGVCEIEFGNDLLNSPRNILDDIAILCSRYSNNYKDIYPLIISLQLPNTRSQYWRVIQDINKVLKIKIHSLSLGSLLLLLWNLQKIDILSHNFYADCDNLSIRNSIESILNRQVNLPTGYNSILEINK